PLYRASDFPVQLASRILAAFQYALGSTKTLHTLVAKRKNKNAGNTQKQCNLRRLGEARELMNSYPPTRT
ncbi:MAG: hypothetical protein RMH97_05375, partial [Verrucomicrobiales bacterium]|nr:hypothetical protein [Verrucomicrobiales bacterium]